MFKVAVITASDKGSQGLREDASGQVICDLMERAGYEIHSKTILPDEKELISAKLIDLADEKIDLVLTTGGTGFSMRDWTPEATLAVIERQVPGIPEAMRSYSLQITKKAMLSRAVAGIRGQTLIINLPGSPKAVTECLEYILEPLKHGLEILKGSASECAR
jgi:molybdopterin adenylyltransferase